MVPKNLVMYFSVVKKEKQKFLKKVENSECTAALKVKNQKSRIFSFKKNIWAEFLSNFQNVHTQIFKKYSNLKKKTF